MMSEDIRSEQVKVFCRIRPSNDTEDECISVLDDTSLSIQNKRHPTTKSIHTFTHLFTLEATQNDVFSNSLSPYVNSVMNGENALFFTYGVTGSGKTHTMQGSLEDPGLIPRTLDTVFNSISSYSTYKYVVKPDGFNGFDLQSEAEAILDRQRYEYSSKPRTPYRFNGSAPELLGRYIDSTTYPISQDCLYTVFISFVELYNNSIFDLLDQNALGGGRSLNLHEDAQRNTYAQGITEMEVKTANEALAAYYQGQKRRKVGSTVLNKDSSRSHAVFTIRIVRSGYDTNYDEVIPDKSLLTVNQLCLVDLAGSERTTRSGTTGGRLKEAATINNSLMTLRKCVEILRSNQASRASGGQSLQQIVPYRDCKLTRLFKSFFEGNGQVGILVCVHPTNEEYTETLQVLQFAEKSQQITTAIPSTPLVPTTRSGRSSSSALTLFNEELLTSIAQTTALDASLKTCVARITASDNEALNLCGCPTRKRASSSQGSGRRSSKHARKSSITRKHGDDCPLFSVLNARAEERERMRSVFVNLMTELRSGVCDLVKRAEDRDSHLTLLDTMDALKVEKLQMESKVRHLENEVTRQKMLVRHERAERLKETDGARAQLKKLRSQVDAATPRATPAVARTLPRRGRGGGGGRRQQNGSSTSSGSIESRPSITGKTTGRRRTRNAAKGPAAPSTVSRVATLSRQWESRMAAARLEQQQEESLRARLGTGTPLRRADILNRPPAMNPRHRRSKSVGSGATWLEHKENHQVPLGTIFSPSAGVKIRKSATQIELGDTLKATNYMLHHQTATEDGNVETQLYKGSIIPTAGGGSAVIFNDVEELRQTSPLGVELRRSARLSIKHALASATETEDEDHPPPKRRASSRNRARYSSGGHASSTSGIGVGVDSEKDFTDNCSEGRRSQTSYRTISPPSRYIGISSGGGITGGGKGKY